MADGSRDEMTIDDLIGVLERAPAGSRDLDRRIAALLGLPIGESEQMVKLLQFEGYSWDVISELVQSQNPCFSSALDACIPGENIVLAMQSTKRGQWAAIHRSVGGAEFVAWAATEALARRAAALKGLRSVSAFEAKSSPLPEEKALPGSSSPRPEIQQRAHALDKDVEPESGSAEPPNGGEWKILF